MLRGSYAVGIRSNTNTTDEFICTQLVLNSLFDPTHSYNCSMQATAHGFSPRHAVRGQPGAWPLKIFKQSMLY